MLGDDQVPLEPAERFLGYLTSIEKPSTQVMHVMARNSRATDNATKRHATIDALGLLLAVLITAAPVQDRDAARPLLWNLRTAFRSTKLRRLRWEARHVGQDPPALETGSRQVPS